MWCQRSRQQSAVRKFSRAEDHVETLVHQIDRSVGETEVHGYLRVLPQVLGNLRRECVASERDGRTDTKSSSRDRTSFGDQRFGGLQFTQDVLRPFVKHAASV